MALAISTIFPSPAGCCNTQRIRNAPQASANTDAPRANCSALDIVFDEGKDNEMRGFGQWGSVGEVGRSDGSRGPSSARCLLRMTSIDEVLALNNYIKRFPHPASGARFSMMSLASTNPSFLMIGKLMRTVRYPGFWITR